MMNQMNVHTSKIFSDLRKFHRYTQIEMASILGVSQSAISKVETGVFVPELTLWFKFVSHFGLLDPYCFYYGTMELSDIPKIANVNSEKWHGVWLPKHAGRFSMSVRALGPLIRHLQKHQMSALKELLRHNGAPLETLSILNYPIPWDVASEMFELGMAGKKPFQLNQMKPVTSDHGALFKECQAVQDRPHAMDFLLARASDYFGTIDLSNPVESIPDLDISSQVKKAVTRYITTYPEHLTKAAS